MVAPTAEEELSGQAVHTTAAAGTEPATRAAPHVFTLHMQDSMPTEFAALVRSAGQATHEVAPR